MQIRRLACGTPLPLAEDGGEGPGDRARGRAAKYGVLHESWMQFLS